MAGGWLRSVEDLLRDDDSGDDGFDEPDPEGYGYGYGYEYGRPVRDLGEYTQVVLIDGQVVDSARHPISGSQYECAALELDHLRGLPPEPVTRTVEVRVPPHEAMAHWLERVVGSREALATLDMQSLPESTPVDPSAAADPERELVQAVDRELERASAGWVVTHEVLTACRRLLVAAEQAGMLRIWRDLEPAKVAAIIVHCIAKANGLVGQGAAFTVAHWLRDLGTTAAPATRSRTLAETIGGAQWPHGKAPTEVPDVYVLGDPSMLVSRFRTELIHYRDLARRHEQG
ncbi:hypothetical protein ACTHQ1_00170 [Janibacter anophelis]|uniref:hypothetical protein n=1 Tax=Janibacter anophelis TaxID=319054 RepID=UPI003F7F6EB5